MANIGPIPVPAALAPFLPYAKFAIAAAGVVAAAVIAAVAVPPAWAFIVVAAVSALGVFTIPNDNIKAVLVDGHRAVDSGEAALAAARAGNLPLASSDVTQAFQAVEDGVKNAEAVVTDVKDAGKP
jgi:hypothetical protein